MKLTALLSVVILFFGCKFLAINASVEDVFIQATSENLGIQIARIDPGIVKDARAFCIAVLNSDDKNIEQLIKTGTKYLIVRYNKIDPLISQNIKYLLMLIQINEGAIDIRKAKLAANAFYLGLSV